MLYDAVCGVGGLNYKRFPIFTKSRGNVTLSAYWHRSSWLETSATPPTRVKWAQEWVCIYAVTEAHFPTWLATEGDGQEGLVCTWQSFCWIEFFLNKTAGNSLFSSRTFPTSISLCTWRIKVLSIRFIRRWLESWDIYAIEIKRVMNLTVLIMLISQAH